MSSNDESMIPIDIHYNKLLDWLISRRHCTKSWQGSALKIREKINEAISDMPETTEITELLSGTYINYFHCVQIVELLKETESSTKNIFGRYSSQRMKDWQEVVRLYEKDGICLADSAQLLTRSVNYEINTIKKQIQKCKQTHQDAVAKQNQYTAAAHQAKHNFQQSCQKLGIQGERIRSEILALVKDVPDLLENVAEQTKNFEESVNYYQGYVIFTLETDKFSEESLPLLKHIIRHGNTTVYQWNHGKVPTEIVDDEINSQDDSANQADDDAEIDWGGDEIDFDISAETSGISSTQDESGCADIDWGVIEIGDDSKLDHDTGIARGVEAKTVLDNLETRNKFLEELFELEAFLDQSISDKKSAESSLTLPSHLESAPKPLQISNDKLQEMLRNVRNVLKQLSDKNTQDLLHIRSHPSYVDRMTTKLEAIRANSEKNLSLCRISQSKQQELLDEEISLVPKLNALKVKTKLLQKEIQDAISKKYNNRRVNIMGEINLI